MNDNMSLNLTLKNNIDINIIAYNSVSRPFFMYVQCTPWPITTVLRTPKCQFIVYSHTIQIRHYEISFFHIPLHTFSRTPRGTRTTG
jgi:hypothetical protein